MKNRKRVVAASIVAALVLCAAITANLEVSIRQGIDGCAREIKMPLYVKGMEFLARHYEYGRIAKEVTQGCAGDEEKVLAILAWTHENIRKVPQGMPIIDDHILNIIIRGYGTSDQSQDVFTTLCAYSGIPAYWAMVFDNARRVKYPISVVKLGGKWCPFDSYRGKYFKTRRGAIASTEDIAGDRSLVEGKEISENGEEITVEGVPYKEFFYNLHPRKEGRTLRPEKQMPLKRVFFEMKRMLQLEHDEEKNKSY